MNDTLEEFKQQHFINYKTAILENIKNNSSVLVDDDIMSLLKKPPLDSMDLIKTKFLDIAKKNKIILNTEELDNILNLYRKDITKCCNKIKDFRIKELSSIVDDASLVKETDIIKINKKDFTIINKKIKTIIKEQLSLSSNKIICKKIDKVFTESVNDVDKKKISGEILKYVSGIYQRQLLENIDIKILVKDTTLMNGVKEQAERHIFTLQNSRIFKD